MYTTRALDTELNFTTKIKTPHAIIMYSSPTCYNVRHVRNYCDVVCSGWSIARAHNISSVGRRTKRRNSVFGPLTDAKKKKKIKKIYPLATSSRVRVVLKINFAHTPRPQPMHFVCNNSLVYLLPFGRARVCVGTYSAVYVLRSF
jgi:hypothetical protein